MACVKLWTYFFVYDSCFLYIRYAYCKTLVAILRSKLFSSALLLAHAAYRAHVSGIFKMALFLHLAIRVLHCFCRCI